MKLKLDIVNFRIVLIRIFPTSCLASRDLSGQESNIEVDLSSTLSRPYRTCCLVSMNLNMIVRTIPLLPHSLFAEEAAGLKGGVGKG